MGNQAYYMTISIQKWLAIRLDVFRNALILGIALFAAGFRHTVKPGANAGPKTFEQDKLVRDKI